jgi:hypothetical protein
MYKQKAEKLYQAEVRAQYLRITLLPFILYYAYEYYGLFVWNEIQKWSSSINWGRDIRVDYIDYGVVVICGLLALLVANFVVRTVIYLTLGKGKFKKFYKQVFHEILNLNLRKGKKEDLVNFKKGLKKLETLNIRNRSIYEDYYISEEGGEEKWSFCEFRTQTVSRGSNGNSRGKLYSYHVYRFKNFLDNSSHFFLTTKGSSFLTLKDLKVKKAEEEYGRKIADFFSKHIAPWIVPVFKGLYWPATKFLKNKHAWKDAEAQFQKAQERYQQNKEANLEKAKKIMGKLGGFIDEEQIEKMRSEIQEEHESRSKDNKPKTISLFIIAIYLIYTIILFNIFAFLIEVFNLEDVLVALFGFVMFSVFLTVITVSLWARIKYKNYSLPQKRYRLGNEKINDIYSIGAQSEENIQLFLKPHITKSLLEMKENISVEALEKDLYIMIETNENLFELPSWLPGSLDKLLKLHQDQFKDVFELKKLFYHN